MQRDLKVGLSLGVLILGVVGALLFRRDQISETPKPTLKTGREIDERIAEGYRTPYMTGDVEFDQDDAEKTRPETAKTANGRPAHSVAPDWLDDEEDPFLVARKGDGRFDFRHPADSAESPTPVQSLRPSTGANPPAAAQGELRTHVIQSGDSLSMLAERYLGSQGRFQEIYDANHDILTDANRLPLGATIVIPPATKAASKTTASKTNPRTAVGSTSPATPGAGTTVAGTKVAGDSGQAATTATAAMNQPDKARGRITDVSIFEPLAPPSADDDIPELPVATVKDKPAAETAPTVKVQETKKFVTPSRLPFANQNHAKPANPYRKSLESDSEDFNPAKPATPSAATSGKSDEGHVYQVRKGDSLEKISTKVYGNARRAGDIFAANKQTLASPNALREGQELVLPE